MESFVVWLISISVLFAILCVFGLFLLIALHDQLSNGLLPVNPLGLAFFILASTAKAPKAALGPSMAVLEASWPLN